MEHNLDGVFSSPLVASNQEEQNLEGVFSSPWGTPNTVPSTGGTPNTDPASPQNGLRRRLFYSSPGLSPISNGTVTLGTPTRSPSIPWALDDSPICISSDEENLNGKEIEIEQLKRELVALEEQLKIITARIEDVQGLIEQSGQ